MSRDSATFDDLLGYLDSVETEMTKDIVLPDLSQAEELHQEVSNRITELESTVQATKQREAAAKNELQKCIAEAKEIIAKKEKEKIEIKTRMTKKLSAQKAKYEEILKRHQALMDGLIKEKESLARDCETLSKKAQVAREEATRREREVQEQAAQQIAQQRELAIAQERARQKKNFEQKIKEVKEATVRGLEPELQNLMARQKREIEAIKAEHEEALKQVRSNAERRIDEERQRALDQVERDKQAEFEAMEQRLQRQIEREREVHKEEVERLMRKLKTMETEKVAVVQVTRNENDQLLEETRERYKAELSAEKMRMAKEAEQFESRLRAAVEKAKQDTLATFQPRQDEIRKEVEAGNKERNEKKLRAVIQRLEGDMNQQKKRIIEDCERKVTAAQNETKKVRALLESERQQHEAAVEALRKQIADEKSLSNRLELENDKLTQEVEHQRLLKTNLQKELGEKETDLSQMRIDMSKREANAREMALSDLKEIRQQLEDARAENRKQRQDFQAEKKQLEEQHASELAAVSVKVKSLVESKDNTIQNLKEQLVAAQTRLTEIEKIFHQQKKTILAKSKK